MLLERVKSYAVYSKTLDVIPGGVNSPVRSFKEVGIPPLIVKNGFVDTIIDVDGNRYIDFCMSWGALILGHADQDVCQAVSKQVCLGSTFGIATEIEQQAAEELVSFFPGMDKVRFVSSGTEAVMSALRVARGYTGKAKIIKFTGNYHGHFDPLLVKAGSFLGNLCEASSKGVVSSAIQDTIILPYNDIEALKKVFKEEKDIAAVIVEPVAANMGVVPATLPFLRALRYLTKKRSSLLIFDEVITGLRLSLKGSYPLHGIEPDLYCLGKIVGGGLPAAAFGGKKKIMDCLSPLGGVYQAGTLSGNPLALAAGLATIAKLKEPGFYQKLEDKASFLLQDIKQYLVERKLPVQLQQQGSLFTLFFSSKPITCWEDLAEVNHAMFKEFFLHLFSRGIYFSPSQYEANFLSIAHTQEHLAYTKEAILSFFQQF